MQAWLRTHQGRVVTEFQISEIFGIAFGKDASVKNGCSGFEKAGIYPFRRDLLTEEDFAPSAMTDKPMTLPASSGPSRKLTSSVSSPETGRL